LIWKEAAKQHSLTIEISKKTKHNIISNTEEQIRRRENEYTQSEPLVATRRHNKTEPIDLMTSHTKKRRYARHNITNSRRNLCNTAMYKYMNI
jgi:hypothetical protein